MYINSVQKPILTSYEQYKDIQCKVCAASSYIPFQQPASSIYRKVVFKSSENICLFFGHIYPGSCPVICQARETSQVAANTLLFITTKLSCTYKNYTQFIILIQTYYRNQTWNAKAAALAAGGYVSYWDVNHGPANWRRYGARLRFTLSTTALRAWCAASRTRCSTSTANWQYRRGQNGRTVFTTSKSEFVTNSENSWSA